MLVSSFFPAVGGVQRATLDLCRRLAERGRRVVLLTRRLPDTPRFERLSGIWVYRLGLARADKLGALSFGVHALWLLATSLRCRLLHVQNIDTPLLVGLLAKYFLGRRLIVTIHGEAKISMQRRDRLFGRQRLRLMRRAVDAFGALSDPMVAKLESVGVDRRRIWKIPNGIDTETFRPPTAAERTKSRRDLGIREDDVVAVFLGRLVRLKRVDLILRAWADVQGPDRSLLIVGDGPEHESLGRLRDELGLQRVRFLGSREEVRDLLWSGDFSLLPSEREGLSVALLEAMAVGLPSVASDVPGNEEVVTHRETGLLVPVGDEEALRSSISQMIESADLRRRLGIRARRHIVRDYGLEAVTTAHERLYRAVSPPATTPRVESFDEHGWTE